MPSGAAQLWIVQRCPPQESGRSKVIQRTQQTGCSESSGGVLAVIAETDKPEIILSVWDGSEAGSTTRPGSV
jgi:hypothetical protein